MDDATDRDWSRRNFLRASAITGTGIALGCARTDRGTTADTSTRHGSGTDSARSSRAPADVTIRIAPVLVELAPDHIISTVGYNGSVPAPPIRLREGRPVSVELINNTDTPELVHWHGQLIPSDIDGSSEEGTPFVPPHGTQRYTVRWRAMLTIKPQQPRVVPRQACGRYTCCALAPQVHNLGTGEEDNGPTMVPQPPAEIHLLGKEKIALVERTHTLDRLTP